MQTFLPYADFDQSAKILDNKRLGKQRVEVKQIYRALLGETKGWRNHPATVMWRGYEKALLNYGIAICREWQRRGFEDSLMTEFMAERNDSNLTDVQPWWLGNPTFHESHQSNLYRKDPDHYFAFASVGAGLPYLWPQGSHFKVGTLPKMVPA